MARDSGGEDDGPWVRGWAELTSSQARSVHESSEPPGWRPVAGIERAARRPGGSLQDVLETRRAWYPSGSCCVGVLLRGRLGEDRLIDGRLGHDRLIDGRLGHDRLVDRRHRHDR